MKQESCWKQKEVCLAHAMKKYFLCSSSIPLRTIEFTVWLFLSWLVRADINNNTEIFKINQLLEGVQVWIYVYVSVNGGDFYAERVMEWMIRAVFDLLFTMCHLIASISPYHTLLVPLITVQEWEGSREESKRERRKKKWRVSWRRGRGAGKSHESHLQNRWQKEEDQREKLIPWGRQIIRLLWQLLKHQARR